MMRNIMLMFLVVTVAWIHVRTADSAFMVTNKLPFLMRNTVDSSLTSLQMSFVADGSEYSSKKGDYEKEDETTEQTFRTYKESMADAPTIEMKPVPTSKNSGNRFVAFVFDKALDTQGRKMHELFYDRQALTEDHVMFCRKNNLYNDTFNNESMVDILWSLPILSSDLQRIIGHAMCMETTQLVHIHDLLSREPLVKSLTGGDTTQIPLYRWRHIRDYTLRQDDGRFGCPCMMIALDHENVANLRAETNQTHLEYLIRSERVIAAGPLHLPTEFKDDPSSLAVGNLVLFNAPNRTDAIHFCEHDPCALQGLYASMRVHFYNNLDITGKFVSEDELRDAPCSDMKDAMEVWGYPVDDAQTPWLNW